MLSPHPFPFPRRTNADALKARDIGSYSTRIGNIPIPFMDAGLFSQPWVGQGDIAKQPLGLVKS